LKLSDNENPTPSNEGASITERLEKYLAAEDSPEPADTQSATQDAAVDEPEKQAAQTQDKPEGDVPGDDKQPQITTADLAKYLGVDESALDVDGEGNPVFKTKIDGKEGSAKFNDIVKSYQIQGHAENKARAVAEQEKALQTRMQEADQAFAQRLNHAEALTKLAAEELMAEFNQYDWKALESHADQGAVAALKLRFRERQEKIGGALQNIGSQRQQLDQKAQHQNAQRLQVETEKLPTLIPEWKDAEVAKREVAELGEYVLKAGYPQAFVAALNHSSALEVSTVRKAMLFDRLQGAKPAIENRVRTAPKIVKPGQAQQDGAGQQLRSLKQTVIKSGGKSNSVADWLIAAGKV
jgi:hypothetical protein